VFPKDTLRPGAHWFMKQIDFPTAHEHHIIESKVVVMDPHIDFVMKVAGTFFEVMELEAFPADFQELTVNLSLSVANEGICPVQFRNLLEQGGHLVATVNTSSFSMSNMWSLADVACVKAGVIRPMEQTSYPCLSIKSLAARRQGYYIFNVVLPLGGLQLLGCFQFLLPGEFGPGVADRVSFSVALLLTSAAYKLYVSDSLPDISYLTLIDRYVLVNFFSQIMMIIPSIVLGFFRRAPLPVAPLVCFGPCDPDQSYLTSGQLADLGMFAFALLAFLALHMWMARVLIKCGRLQHSTINAHAKRGAMVAGTDDSTTTRRRGSMGIFGGGINPEDFKEDVNSNRVSEKVRERATDYRKEMWRRNSQQAKEGDMPAVTAAQSKRLAEHFEPGKRSLADSQPLPSSDGERRKVSFGSGVRAPDGSPPGNPNEC